MRISLLSTLLMITQFIIGDVSAQVISDQVSLSPGYATQSFYALQDGEVANVNNTDWDIAFMTDAFNSSILVNDNVATSLYLYSSDVSDWSSVDTAGTTWTELYNSETEWEKGAFTKPQSSVDPFDYGWGQYNVITHIVTGNRIFIIKLSNGEYKKVIIEGLDLGTYSFKYADLDGSNEVSESVNSADYGSKNFWYYSMQTQEIIDREPATETWDLTFTRFTSEIAPDFNYVVAGALQNVNITAAEASEMATDEAVWHEYPMMEDINVLGADWKYFDMDIFEYVIEESLSYFVQDGDGNVWQLIFTGFGGAADGTIDFTKEMISATGLNEDSMVEFSVYPNPNNGFVTVILPIEQDQAYYTLIDGQGRAVYADTWSSGFEHGIDLFNVPAGIYLLQVEMNGAIGQQRLVIR